MRASRLIRETVDLRDGRKVVLRPVRPEDATGLMHLHSRLSSDTQYLRFFGPKPYLAREEAEYLARVDFTRRFAIVGAVTEDDDERIVAVGRFDIVEEGVAEPAIVVRDDYQGSGLGTAILERMLEVARGRGVERFAAEVLAENERMLQLLRQAGLDVGDPRDGVVRVTAPVGDAPFTIRGLELLARSALVLLEKGGSLKRLRGRDESP